MQKPILKFWYPRSFFFYFLFFKRKIFIAEYDFDVVAIFYGFRREIKIL